MHSQTLLDFYDSMKKVHMKRSIISCVSLNYFFYLPEGFVCKVHRFSEKCGPK